MFTTDRLINKGSRFTLSIIGIVLLLTACGLGNTDHPAQHAASAPQLKVETDDKNRLVLNWPVSKNATSYQLVWSTSAELTNTSLIDHAQPPYPFNAGNPGDTIYAKLNATWEGNVGKASNVVSFTRPPNAPETKSATIENNQVVVEWNKSDSAEKYRIYRSTETNVTTQNTIVIADGIAASESDKLRYVDTTAEPSKTYYYIVVAVNGDNASQLTTPVKIDTPSTLPTITRGDPPSNVSVKSDTGIVTLNWTSPTNSTTFNIYRGANADITPGGAALVSGLTTTGYTDKEVLIGATYYYVITSVNNGVESKPSITQQATPTVTTGTATYTIGGTVKGLIGSNLKLTNNGIDALKVDNNGTFTFNAKGVTGTKFNVGINTQPTRPSQTCIVTNGAGDLRTANETNISVDCTTNQFAVRVEVKGLEGSGLVLQNNGTDDLAIPSNTNGVYTFSKTLLDRSQFVISAKTQPSQKWQTCAAPVPLGVLDGTDVTVVVECKTDLFNVKGNVDGLKGSFKINANGNTTTIDGTGTQTLLPNIERGSAYSLSIAEQPYRQTCYLDNASGTLNVSTDITSVSVTCLDHFELEVEPSTKSVSLSWNYSNVNSFNVFVTTDKNCNFENYISCTGGTVFNDVQSPYRVVNLIDGQAYYFKVEAALANSRKLYSITTGGKPNIVGTNGIVKTIAPVANGGAIIGGDFTQIGPVSGGGVAFDHTRAIAALVPELPTIAGAVRAVAADGNGGWYIGGWFTHVGGIARNNIAHIRADGSVDPVWNPNANNSISALAVAGSEIYVGGGFTTIGNVARNRIARIFADGSVDISWNPNASGSVYTLAIFGNFVYVGGSFSSIGGQLRNRIARLLGDGNADPTWNPNANATVMELVVSGDITYVGGSFTSIGGQSRNYIARLLADGNADPGWDPNANNYVYALAVNGSNLYVGGLFNSIGGQTRNFFARLLADGRADLSWNTNADNTVQTLAAVDNSVYVGGSFTTIGGISRNRVARFRGDGSVDPLWNPNVSDTVRVIAVSGSAVYVGGEFAVMSGKTRNNIARILAGGSLDLNWDANANSYVNSIVVYGNYLYVGGAFTSIAGQSRNYIARLLTTGSADTIWNPGANDWVNAIAVVGNNAYAGGHFTTIGGQARNRIARVLSNGVVDATWNPNADGPINTLDAYANYLYVGGGFTSIGGEFRNRIARLVADGKSDATWNPNSDGFVTSLAFENDKVYVSGLFTSIGGQPRNRIARLLATGGPDPAWNPNSNGIVTTLALINGTIYTGGSFTSIAGQERNRLARLSLNDGNADTNWNPNVDNAVFSLSISGSNVYVGGQFSAIAGHSRANFAILNSDGSLQ